MLCVTLLGPFIEGMRKDKMVSQAYKPFSVNPSNYLKIIGMCVRYIV